MFHLPNQVIHVASPVHVHGLVGICHVGLGNGLGLMLMCIVVNQLQFLILSLILMLFFI